ncbi:MAG TPA: enoyl-CoA hydratase/isomerase family protein, partial [Dehalococcoidia bacterium]|nr:enoyl-CoA hydratase/isomerase family protein [Dehalococcoidia bacterium]
MPDLIAVERHPGVAVIRLTRTEQRNAFNRDLDVAVSTALQEFDADPEVKCVVLTGSGTAFSAGADFNEAVAAMDEGTRGQGLALTYAALAALRKPIIAAVNGAAYGGGALVSIMCDIRIASEDAAFRFPGAAYGLVVGGARLPRIVGDAVAKDLLFTARVVRADEAARIGLVNRVVPRAEVDAAALEM